MNLLGVRQKVNRFELRFLTPREAMCWYKGSDVLCYLMWKYLNYFQWFATVQDCYSFLMFAVSMRTEVRWLMIESQKWTFDAQPRETSVFEMLILASISNVSVKRHHLKWICCSSTFSGWMTQINHCLLFQLCNARQQLDLIFFLPSRCRSLSMCSAPDAEKMFKYTRFCYINNYICGKQ